jgi:predicted component of type VI protein secretion system
LGSLEEKVDKRLQETRPIWGSVQQQLTDMRPIWEGVQQQLTDLRSEMESNYRRFDRKFDQLIRDMFEDRATLSELNNRVGKLEEKAS